MGSPVTEESDRVFGRRQNGVFVEVGTGVESELTRTAELMSWRVNTLKELALVFDDARVREGADLRVGPQTPREDGCPATVQTCDKAKRRDMSLLRCVTCKKGEFVIGL